VSGPDPIRTARRRTQRVERLGSDAFCLLCGYRCLEALTQASRRWVEARGVTKERINRLLEQHHMFGAAHDPNLLLTVCLNCHREITEGLAREGVSMYPDNDQQKLIILVLRASAVLFDFLARSYRKWASLLEREVEKQ